ARSPFACERHRPTPHRSRPSRSARDQRPAAHRVGIRHPSERRSAESDLPSSRSRRHRGCLSSPAMRVAYICADLGVPIFGTKGCSVHAQEVLRALWACGAEMELFAASLDGDAPSDLFLLRVVDLPLLAGRGLVASHLPYHAGTELV